MKESHSACIFLSYFNLNFQHDAYLHDVQYSPHVASAELQQGVASIRGHVEPFRGYDRIHPAANLSQLRGGVEEECAFRIQESGQ